MGKCPKKKLYGTRKKRPTFVWKLLQLRRGAHTKRGLYCAEDGRSLVLRGVRCFRNLLHSVPPDMHLALPNLKKLELYGNLIEGIRMPEVR